MRNPYVRRFRFKVNRCPVYASIFMTVAILAVLTHQPKVTAVLQDGAGATRITVPQRPPLDFDGDGFADPAVVRGTPPNLTWFIQRSSLGFKSEIFGDFFNDVPLRGDYDGDAKADIATYRFPINTFFIHYSSNGSVQSKVFGAIGADFKLPGDFDGDGKTDYAVWRSGDGAGAPWFWLQSSDGGFRALNFGSGATYVPVPGDYDGDGKTDQAVWRAGSPAVFFVNRSMMGFTSIQFGQTGDIAVASQLQAHFGRPAP